MTSSCTQVTEGVERWGEGKERFRRGVGGGARSLPSDTLQPVCVTNLL